MAVPYKFISGTIAESAQLNANFLYLENLLGAMSTNDELVIDKSMKVGSYGQITGVYPNFIHLGFNTLLKRDGSKYPYTRRKDDLHALSVRVGTWGFQVFGTLQKTGSLEPQLKELFAIRNWDGKQFMLLPSDMPIRTKQSDHIDDARLLYTPFNTPKKIMERAWKGWTAGESLDLTTHGVPAHARAVEVLVYATATTSSGAAYKMMRAEQTPHHNTGIICHAYGGPTANWGRSAAQGKVLLGEGTYKGKVRVECTAGFSELSVYIQGFYS